MDDNSINISLIKKLTDCGAIRLNRSISYQGFIINEFYLESEEMFINYCTNYAFRNKNQDKSKRKVALLLATLIINYQLH